MRPPAQLRKTGFTILAVRHEIVYISLSYTASIIALCYLNHTTCLRGTYYKFVAVSAQLQISLRLLPSYYFLPISEPLQSILISHFALPLVAIHLVASILLINTHSARLEICSGFMLFVRSKPTRLEPLGLVTLPGLLPLHTWVVDRRLWPLEDGDIVNEATEQSSKDGCSPGFSPPALHPHVRPVADDVGNKTGSQVLSWVGLRSGIVSKAGGHCETDKAYDKGVHTSPWWRI